jgi:hypothetical protein
MTNLLLLKTLLPAEYRVIGTPQKVLVISPFKTFFGFIEVAVEDEGNKYVIINQDIPYQFKLLGFESVLRRIKDFTTYPVKIQEDSLVVEVPHNEKDTDLIQLAKTVDGFIKDLYDFVNNLTSIESVKQRLGAVAVASFKLKKLKEKQLQKLENEAEKIKAQMVELYEDIKADLLVLEALIKKRKYEEANNLLSETLKKLGKLEALKDKYKAIKGEDFYEFQINMLRDALFSLEEKLKT